MYNLERGVSGSPQKTKSHVSFFEIMWPNLINENAARKYDSEYHSAPKWAGNWPQLVMRSCFHSLFTVATSSSDVSYLSLLVLERNQMARKEKGAKIMIKNRSNQNRFKSK